MAPAWSPSFGRQRPTAWRNSTRTCICSRGCGALLPYCTLEQRLVCYFSGFCVVWWSDVETRLFVVKILRAKLACWLRRRACTRCNRLVQRISQPTVSGAWQPEGQGGAVFAIGRCAVGITYSVPMSTAAVCRATICYLHFMAEEARLVLVVGGRRRLGGGNCGQGIVFHKKFRHTCWGQAAYSFSPQIDNAHTILMVTLPRC